MNASVIQAFQWLIWEKKHDLKMAKWQLLENIVRFINFLLYTDQFFCNDYLDFFWFEVKLKTFI